MMPLNDRECPSCGVVVYRTHHCRGARREPLTREQVAANVADIRRRLAEPPAPVVEPLMLDLDLETGEKP